jgi:hypothetical protein
MCNVAKGKFKQPKKKIKFFMNPLKWIKNAMEHLTEEPSAPIVIEPTSERIIMKTTINAAIQVREWSIDRIRQLSESKNTEDHLNAISMSEEFSEWIGLEEDDDLNYMCLEMEDDFGDQEIDVR